MAHCVAAAATDVATAQGTVCADDHDECVEPLYRLHHRLPADGRRRRAAGAQAPAPRLVDARNAHLAAARSISSAHSRYFLTSFNCRGTFLDVDMVHCGAYAGEF